MLPSVFVFDFRERHQLVSCFVELFLAFIKEFIGVARQRIFFRVARLKKDEEGVQVGQAVVYRDKLVFERLVRRVHRFQNSILSSVCGTDARREAAMGQTRIGPEAEIRPCWSGDALSSPVTKAFKLWSTAPAGSQPDGAVVS